jgi:nucleoside phosphorylase
MSHPRILTHQDYTVGWICALPYPELAAAFFMLDSEHSRLPRKQADTNNYTLGSIGLHNVVIACLPQGEYGISSAASVALQMNHSFPNIQFGLMVGIAGGVPNFPEIDIRLGDVVVSKPGIRNGGVVQYDFGKAIDDDVFEQTGWLDAPPMILRTAIGALEAREARWGNKFMQYLSAFESKEGSRFAHPGLENDQLYEAVDTAKLVARPNRPKSPVVHYGTIASGSSLIKNGRQRDKLREKHGILCFEMEAAGLMNNFPCAVIRGICDYADSHKNKLWQPYAAATAAAYAKYLLSQIDPIEVPTKKGQSLSYFINVIIGILMQI